MDWIFVIACAGGGLLAGFRLARIGAKSLESQGWTTECVEKCVAILRNRRSHRPVLVVDYKRLSFSAACGEAARVAALGSHCKMTLVERRGVIERLDLEVRGC